MSHLNELQKSIEPFKKILRNHPINSYIISQEHLSIFMQNHIFAVWDFMSLVKKLQVELTSVDSLWFPKGSGETRYLINEIVLGEESDIDPTGGYISHFDLYLRAMDELAIMPPPALKAFRQFKSIEEFLIALPSFNLPQSINEFLTFTFSSILNGESEEIAAIFTFGREDLIPEMFQLILNQLRLQSPDKVKTLTYYLERHIEVDGGHHSQLAISMVSQLCQDDLKAWDRATQAAINSLKARIKLWDGIVAAKI
jgi:hypothetical protein